VTVTRLTGLTSREVGVAALLFVLSLPAVTPRIYASDEVQYFAYVRSLWFDHDVSFDNEYRHFHDGGVIKTEGFRETFLDRETITGHRETFATIGAALMWLPFYAAGDVLTRVLQAAGSDLPADGYSRLYIAAVAYGSAFYGFAALLLAAGVARRLTGHGTGPAFAVWLGTPLLFYMYAAPPFAHACSAFAVALFIRIWLEVRTRWSPAGMAALGAAGALMTMVREQDVLYGVGPVVDFGLMVAASLRTGVGQPAAGGAGERRESPGRPAVAVLAGVLAFMAAYAPQLLAYMSINGRMGPSTLVTRKMHWLSPHAGGVLGSPNHGLFAWTPLAILSVGGLILLWLRPSHGADPSRASQVSRIGGCMLLMLAAQVYVSGSVDSWTVAGAFGQRRFVGATLLLVVGLGALRTAASAPVPRAVLVIFMVLAIWWNVGLMALFGANLMDRQRLTLARNAYDVFVTLPRIAPGLLHRYLFDRRSFYKNPGPPA
jgi:hypothetical protein